MFGISFLVEYVNYMHVYFEKVTDMKFYDIE